MLMGPSGITDTFTNLIELAHLLGKPSMIAAGILGERVKRFVTTFLSNTVADRQELLLLGVEWAGRLQHRPVCETVEESSFN